MQTIAISVLKSKTTRMFRRVREVAARVEVAIKCNVHVGLMCNRLKRQLNSKNNSDVMMMF